MPAIMNLTRSGTSCTVMRTSDCKHRAMISNAWDTVDTIALLSCPGTPGFQGALPAGVLWQRSDQIQENAPSKLTKAWAFLPLIKSACFHNY